MDNERRDEISSAIKQLVGEETFEDYEQALIDRAMSDMPEKWNNFDTYLQRALKDLTVYVTVRNGVTGVLVFSKDEVVGEDVEEFFPLKEILEDEDSSHISEEILGTLEKAVVFWKEQMIP